MQWVFLAHVHLSVYNSIIIKHMLHVCMCVLKHMSMFKMYSIINNKINYVKAVPIQHALYSLGTTTMTQMKFTNKL